MDFARESAILGERIREMNDRLRSLERGNRAVGLLDRGFDDVAIWRKIWEEGGGEVCRLKHREPSVRFLDADGVWKSGNTLASTSAPRIYPRGAERSSWRGLPCASPGHPAQCW